MIEGNNVLELMFVPDVNAILSTPLNLNIMLTKHVGYIRKIIKWQERIHNGNFMKTNQ